ncbi:hypothetical protein MTO96_008295 [Rhipicephalus appendiculatus]
MTLSHGQYSGATQSVIGRRAALFSSQRPSSECGRRPRSDAVARHLPPRLRLGGLCVLRGQFVVFREGRVV